MSLIRRIDLRGADRASVDYRASVPRAEFDVEAALAAYSALRTADALKFSIERKGQPMTMTLTLQIE